MINPSPNFITPVMWNVWLQVKHFIPGVQLGGIFANKRGYHNTRENNQEKWPQDYSIELDADKLGPDGKASAIDLTMSDAEMKKRTDYLYRSAVDSLDNRLYPLREFIGTRDNETVYCRIAGSSKGLGQGRGRNDFTRDSTHMWHIHLSGLRKYANDWGAWIGVISVLKGQSLESWELENMTEMDLNLEQRVDFWDEQGNKYWRAGQTMQRRSANVGQLLGWSAEAGWLMHDALPILQKLEAEIVKERADRQMLLSIVQTLAESGTSIDTKAILDKIDSANQEYLHALSALRTENDQLRSRLSQALNPEANLQ